MKAIVFILLNVVLYTSAFNLGVQEKKPNVVEPVKIEVPEVVTETVPNETDKLCKKLNCPQGEMCTLNDGVPTCECIEGCSDIDDERLKVCTSSNTTYESECHFYREKCWCAREDNKCTKKNSLKDTVDYFGKCQAVDKCTEEQKEVFPIRMKLWLDEVLNHLSKEENKQTKKTYDRFIKLAKQTKKDKTERHWIYGVMFEFCQLDKSHDGILNIEEMKELVVPIKALENCIQPFLQECDLNKDSKITDNEWGKCLDLSESEITILRESCKIQH